MREKNKRNKKQRQKSGLKIRFKSETITWKKHSLSQNCWMKSSYNSYLPWLLGGGRPQRWLGGVREVSVLFCFLIQVLVMCVYSFYENSPICTLKTCIAVCTHVHMYVWYTYILWTTVKFNPAMVIGSKKTLCTRKQKYHSMVDFCSKLPDYLQ